MSDVVRSIRSLYILWSSCRDEAYSEHCQTCKIEHFAERIVPEAGLQPKVFRAGDVSKNYGTSINILSKTCKKLQVFNKLLQVS